MKPVRQTDQRLTRVSVCHAFGVGYGVGEPVVHDGHAGGIWVPKPCHLDWCGLGREREKTVALGVASQVNEDIDPVLADLLGHGRVTLSDRAVPVVCKFFELRGHIIGSDHLGIAEYLHLGSVMFPEQRLNKIRAGMAAEIR